MTRACSPCHLVGRGELSAPVANAVRERAVGFRHGRMAVVWQRSPSDPLFPARSDQRVQLQPARVAWRFKTDNLGPRPEFNLQTTPLMVKGVLYATGGTRRSVIALNPGTGELLWKYSLDEGKRGESAPRQLSGRGVALDEREGRADSLRHARLSVDCARREDRPPHSDLRQRRHRRPQNRRRPGDGSGHRRDRFARRADRLGEHDHDRRRSSVGRGAEEPPQPEGLHPRLRRRHRKAPLDLPHRPPGRRVRQRDLVEQLMELLRQRGRLGAHVDRRGARARVHSRWRMQPATTTAAIALVPTCSPQASSRSISRPAGASGTTSSSITTSGTGTFRARRSADITVNGRKIRAIAQPTKQAWVYVLNRETGEPVWPIEERPARRRCADRMVLADAAVPDKPPPSTGRV